MTTVAVKESPILFTAPMISAILAGRKTQTRRVVTKTALDWLQPGMFTPEYVALPENDLSPYGHAGDQLWVRETWYCDDYRVQKGPYLQTDSALDLMYYRERDEAPGGHCYTGFSGETTRVPWKPSIHMPRWASRINLEVTDLRIERVQEISEADALAEGVEDWGRAEDGEPRYRVGDHQDNDPVSVYAHLWDGLNEPRGYGWNLNPWVWVIGFRPLEETVDE